MFQVALFWHIETFLFILFSMSDKELHMKTIILHTLSEKFIFYYVLHNILCAHEVSHGNNPTH